ncbi:MAG: PASTA domain-containing protein, partial [Naasia sp.]
IERMVKQDGSDAAIPASTCQQGIEPEIADAAAWALKGVIEGGSATASNPYDGIDHLAKTGTTDGNTNTWTTGASTKIGLSVLVGQATGDANLRQVSLDSGSAATARHRIWEPIMAAFDDRYGGDDIDRPSGQAVTGRQVEVPDVTGLTAADAQEIIEGAGFTFADGGTRSSIQPAGQVVASDPAGGSNASRGSTVTVFTSDGQSGTPMPDVTGDSSDAALDVLVGNGFSAESISFAYTASGATPANTCTVASSNPAAGSPTGQTAPVTLTLFSPTGSAPPNGCPS